MVGRPTRSPSPTSRAADTPSLHGATAGGQPPDSAGSEQVVVLVVALEVRRDERAGGDQLQAACPDVVESAGGEGTAQPLPLKPGLDLGVEELQGARVDHPVP